MANTVIVHNAAIRRFFRSEEGPVGRWLARKASDVNDSAHNHAPFRDGALIAHLRFAGIFQDAEGMYAVVGTDATSPRQDFPYPVALETGINPWTGEYIGYGPYPFLEPALIDNGFLPVVRRGR